MCKGPVGDGANLVATKPIYYVIRLFYWKFLYKDTKTP